MSFASRMNISDAEASGGGSGGGGSFTVSLSFTALSGSGASSTSGAQGPSTATPSGGVSPYTYAWSETANTGASGYTTINSPTAAASTFTTAGVLGQDTGGSTILMTCTDSVGDKAYASLTVAWFNTNVAP